MKKQTLRLSGTSLIWFAIASCGDGLPAPRDLEGTYRAVLFETTVDGTKTDQLLGGASIQVSLSRDLTVRGRLFVPGGDTNGIDLDANLAGTWVPSKNSLRLSSTADTFMRETDWIIGVAGILAATVVFDGVTIEVILERAPSVE